MLRELTLDAEGTRLDAEGADLDVEGDDGGDKGMPPTVTVVPHSQHKGYDCCFCFILKLLFNSKIDLYFLCKALYLNFRVQFCSMIITEGKRCIARLCVEGLRKMN